MRIGIDIDETIAASFHGLFEYCKAKKWVQADWEDFTEFDICRIPAFNIKREDQPLLWKEYFHANHDSIEQIDGSYAGLSALREQWHVFHAITGRVEETDKEYTELWIARHFPNFFESVHYTNHGDGTKAIPKSEVCKKLGVTIMVDDSFDFVLDLAHGGITAIVLEKPWNKHRTESHPHIIRVKHWNEIPDIITAHANSFA